MREKCFEKGKKRNWGVEEKGLLMVSADTAVYSMIMNKVGGKKRKEKMEKSCAWKEHDFKKIYTSGRKLEYFCF